ncbi:MAG: DNA primase [Boseongicola sp.]
MSLPPGFVDELKTRSSLAQVVGRKVTWDARKSNQGKGDMWAPCPFHQEKTASFHVDDQKGFYYCFGCHAKGDLFSFVQETENVGFMEAVEILAREAGMQMPAQDPKAKEKADRRALLSDVMEQAVQFYRLQLRTAGAGSARDYLTGRGLTDEALGRWDIGFAPSARQGLFQHLAAKNVAPDLIIDAGLAARPDDGGDPYDRFRDRIIFPIRDARGKAIALGGRAMDPNARAKYLNSPETALFDKGRSLFNHGPTREAVGQGVPLLVAEGYMDVIALSGAGFGATVAPLGTAVTEDQLQLLWRMHDEPIIALDGDNAGFRAALRVVDLAMPLIEAGKSLRFCLMPEGLDPDDLIRTEGPGAMRRLVDDAVPMVQLLWRRETDAKVFDSPERRASLDKSLRDAIRKVRDPSLRRHYGDEINRLRRQLFGQSTGPSPVRARNWKDQKNTPTAETKASTLAASGSAFEDQLREAVILGTLARHPNIVEAFISDLEGLSTSLSAHEAVRQAILKTGGADQDNLQKICGEDALEKLFSPRHVQIAPGVQPSADEDVARLSVAEAFAKIAAKRGAQDEIEDAVEDLAGPADEGMTWRLGQVAEALNSAGKSEQDDRADYDIGPNGARIKRDEKDKLTELLGQIDYSKGRSR